MLVLGGCLMTGMAFATNITIPDNSTGNNYFNGGPLPQAGEDNEVEAGPLAGGGSGGSVANQNWDLEGMFLTNYNDTVSMVGGWDFVNGLSAGSNPLGGADGRWTSGDIFISVGSTAPLYGAATSGVVDPTSASSYGYEYVVDVDWTTGGWIAYATTAGGGTELQVAYFEESDPWLRSSGGLAIASSDGLDSGGSALADSTAYGNFSSQTGVTGTGFAGDGGNNNHNRVAFNMSWLDPLVVIPGTDPIEVEDLYFHFTMECGNDNLMGYTDDWDRTPPVPEPASVALLGMGIIGLMGARMRKKRF